ncbi:MAG: exodeoxyribonuclease VII large subunit [Rickettsiales bacterium]|jgi:exodeoxyribonuclease VII large subunit|nr:exodeoxyribonuclease VII large subunit [Rickettsiales bacterium]
MKNEERVSDGNVIFSVSEISQLLKGTVEQTFSNVRIRGEVSGITRATSGHIYLSIKDSDSVINGILWRGTAVNFDLADGIEVIVRGKLTTYPARSNYQVIISEIEVAGAGAILRMLEERKQKLAREGLFDAARKKVLPRFPKVVGIVTSPTGAALQDIMNKLRERLPVRAVLYPAQVQGATAATEVAAGVRYFNAHLRPDVIIVARGGGALEDLLPFSEEAVVRAIAESEVPVVSGVGHDPDWMLCDFAADVRAPTPTGAAEIVVPTKQSLMDELEKFIALIKNSFVVRIQNWAMRLDGTNIKSPMQVMADHRGRVLDLFHNFRARIQSKMDLEKERVAHAGRMLESLSYKNVLRRGFAIVRKDDKIISSKNDFKAPASIEFADGIAAVNN